MGTVVLSSMVVVANVMGAGMIVPQVLLLRRGGRVDGVSPVWVGVGIALNLCWVAYAIHQQVWGIAPVAAIGVVLYGVIAHQYLRIVGSSAAPRVALGVIGSSLAPITALVVAGMPAAGVVLGFSYAVQFTPALWAAMRADRVDGIAAGTWTMAWMEAVAWFAYGAAVADPALIIGGTGGAAMSSAILVCLLRDRARSPAAVAVAA